MNKFFGKGISLNPLQAEAFEKMSAMDTAGLYAHNSMAQLANASWLEAPLVGAAGGAVLGGGSSFFNDKGFFGSAFSGAFSGALVGGAAKGMGSWYSKNAFAKESSAVGTGFMTRGTDGKYSTSFQGSTIENPFRLSNFTGE